MARKMLIANIKGPQGEPGPPGPKGDPGDLSSNPEVINDIVEQVTDALDDLPDLVLLFENKLI